MPLVRSAHRRSRRVLPGPSSRRQSAANTGDPRGALLLSGYLARSPWFKDQPDTDNPSLRPRAQNTPRGSKFISLKVCLTRPVRWFAEISNIMCPNGILDPLSVPSGTKPPEGFSLNPSQSTIFPSFQGLTQSRSWDSFSHLGPPRPLQSLNAQSHGVDF